MRRKNSKDVKKGNGLHVRKKIYNVKDRKVPQKKKWSVKSNKKSYPHKVKTQEKTHIY